MYSSATIPEAVVVIGRIDLFDPFIDASLLDAVLSCLRKGYEISPVAGDTVEDFMREAESRLVQCHTIQVDGCIAAAFATFIENEKHTKSLHVWSVGGDQMREWLVQFLAYLEDVARMEGCSAVKFGGRLGWERLLERYGYETESVVMRRKL